LSLIEDQTKAFHAHYGSHKTIQIPKFGRGMAYEPTTCELLLALSVRELAEQAEVSIHSILQTPITDRISANFVLTTEE
jgi:hypothetical protein